MVARQTLAGRHKFAAAGYNYELTSTCPPRIMVAPNTNTGGSVAKLMKRRWSEQQGQDIAEYAVMLAVILVLVVGTVR
jgi:hypothetical protein